MQRKYHVRAELFALHRGRQASQGVSIRDAPPPLAAKANAPFCDRFWVELSCTGNEVRLEVKDACIGFDVKEATRIGGLGLTSMQERVRMINGRFYIESKPEAGTKIIASVPFADENSIGRASGDDASNIAGADSQPLGTVESN